MVMKYYYRYKNYQCRDTNWIAGGIMNHLYNGEWRVELNIFSDWTGSNWSGFHFLLSMTHDRHPYKAFNELVSTISDINGDTYQWIKVGKWKL